MPWTKFPYPESPYVYTAAELKKAWKQLHAGDAESFPKDAALADAWLAFHAGAFEKATRSGLALGMAGYAVANKATCIYATYLEKSAAKKLALFETVAARCKEQQAQEPQNPAGFYWHAYAMGRYSQAVSVLKALTEGVAGMVRAGLDTTLKLAPQHADAHIALGVFHAEIIDKVGAFVGGLSYGASRSESIRHFRSALKLNPGSAIARVEYAKALAMMEGKDSAAEADKLRREAVALVAHDAMERLDIERARSELGE